MQTEDGALYQSQKTDHTTYGYCLGTEEMAHKRGLQLVKEGRTPSKQELQESLSKVELLATTTKVTIGARLQEFEKQLQKERKERQAIEKKLDKLTEQVQKK